MKTQSKLIVATCSAFLLAGCIEKEKIAKIPDAENLLLRALELAPDMVEPAFTRAFAILLRRCQLDLSFKIEAFSTQAIRREGDQTDQSNQREFWTIHSSFHDG